MKSIFLAFALVLIVRNSAFASDSLEDTCKKVQASNAANDKYEFCVTTLQVVPESRTANLSQLTVIATELSIKNYTYTLGVIKQLLKNQSLSHRQKEALKSCQELYSIGVDDSKVAIDDIKRGDIAGALSNLSAASSTPDDCEDGFSEGDVPSLIPKEDDLASKISILALDIVALLKSSSSVP